MKEAEGKGRRRRRKGLGRKESHYSIRKGRMESHRRRENLKGRKRRKIIIEGRKREGGRNVR